MVTETAAAATAALRRRLTRDEKARALHLLACAREALGDDVGEAAALERAVRVEPGNTGFWDRLSRAYAQARRFRHAEAARARALALSGN